MKLFIFRIAIYDANIDNTNFNIDKLKYYNLDLTTRNVNTLVGRYVPPDTSIKPKIPELEKCQDKISDIKKIIGGVSVLIILISMGLIAIIMYETILLSKKKTEKKKLNESKNHFFFVFFFQIFKI